MPFLRFIARSAHAACIGTAIVSCAASATLAEPVFQTFSVADPQGGEIEVGVWSPENADPAKTHPLVVMSHGNGGWFRSASDTAIALAEAGFVAAALTHAGDNWRDQNRATDMPNRPRQLGLLIDHMVAQGAGSLKVDPERIGAYGFSSGGFTVLAIAGAVSDAGAIAAHCGRDSRFFECGLVARHPMSPASWTGWHRDPRVKAIVAAAPALGYSFTPESLATVRVPVQLWRGSQDRVLPSPHYVEPVRDGLAGRADYHVVDGAGHFDFLPPCDEALARNAPMICAPTPAFDRAAFHDRFNQDVVRFFTDHLKPAGEH